MLKKLIIFILLFAPLSSRAATLYLDPAAGRYSAGDIFGVNVRIDTEKDECINAAEAKIRFTSSLFQIEDFSTGDSILNLWIDKPEKSQMASINRDGFLYFAGGIPGGYCGKVPGDPGDSNIIGQVFFKVRDNAGLDGDEKALVTFEPETKILLNDGFGTLAELTAKNSEYAIGPATGETRKEWEEKVKADNIQPDPFTVELNRDDSIFDGKYFIMYSTTDKQTGIDRYEVMEIKLSDLAKENRKQTWLDLLFRKARQREWITASSPYLLQDQGLESLIRVKAIDKAGNERMVEFTPTADEHGVSIAGGDKNGYLNIYVIIGIILLAIGIAAVVAVKKSRKDKAV